MKIFCIITAAALPLMCGAQTNRATNTITFTTLDGVTWSNARVINVKWDGIVVSARLSGGHIPFTNLPPDIAARYYVPELVEEHERRTNAIAELQKIRRMIEEDSAARLKMVDDLRRELALPKINPGPVRWKILESEYGWTRFSYQVALTNVGYGSFSKSATIRFLDREGFEVEHEFKYPIVIPKKEVFVWTGQFSVKQPKASMITRATVEVGD